MLKFFVKRPVTTIMFVLFWVVLGIYSFPKMNIERMPPMNFPMVTATFVYPGAAPAEMESQIIERAEDAISEIAGIKKITSNAFDNGGFVMAEFNMGLNVNDKATEVKTKLDAIRSEFPDDMDDVLVEKLDPMATPVMDIVLMGADLRDLYEYADETLSNKLTGVSGVSGITVFGGRERAVRIKINPELMAAKGATITDVVSVLGARNTNIPGGRLEVGTDSSNVRFVGEFNNVDEIKNLRMTTMDGYNFAISDIATVVDDVRDIERGAIYNGADVVIASVVKTTDGNAIKISNDLRKNFEAYQSDLDTKFPGAKMEIIYDSSIPIADETNSTIQGIILGIILTTIVLLVFTRNPRSTIVAAVVIPASLISGFFFMQMSGFSVNAMTLLAYSSALGTLISNAIILIEAALSKMRNGVPAETAAIDGTREVAVPILAGVGTNVVVFLPLAFMGGIAGQFMAQFGMTVVYTTLLSLLFSFTLTPMMIAKILKIKGKQEPKAKTQSSRFRKWFDYQIAHPWRIIGGAFGVMILSSMLMQFVGNEFSPATDANEINVTMRAPMGATYEKSASLSKIAVARISKFDGVDFTSVKIGERGLQNISIKVGLLPRAERADSDKELAQKILPELSVIADTEIQIKAGESSGSGMDSADLVLNIEGPDDAKRDEIAGIAIDVINKIAEVQSATLVNQLPGMETRFVPDENAMNFWGVKNAYAGATLRTALFGNDDYKYKEGGNEYPIVIEFDRQYKTSDMWGNVFMNSPKGLVALSDLGKIETMRASPNITRVNKNRITEININIGKSTMGPVQSKIERALTQMKLDDGYRAVFAGMSEIQDETNAEIGTAFMLAIILTFMLLAAIMNSWVHPFTIATSILTSFAGVFVFMFLSGASMNVAAMMAIVMLVGLVVNNNILVLEPTIARIARGEDSVRALWMEFADKRAMILMTSIAIIAGMVPQLWSADGMKVSMGAVLCGGMTASMLFTFLLTPAIFIAMEKLRTRRGKKN